MNMAETHAEDGTDMSAEFAIRQRELIVMAQEKASLWVVLRYLCINYINN